MVEHAALARDLPGAGDGRGAQRHAWCGWRPVRPRSSTRCHAGRLARDGDGLVPLDGEALRERRKLLWNGAAAATLVIDKQGQADGAAQGLACAASRTRTATLAEAIVAGLTRDAGRPQRRRAARRRADRGGGPPGRAARRARAPRQEAVDGRAHRPHLSAHGEPDDRTPEPHRHRRAGPRQGPELYRTVMGAKVSAPKAQPAHGVTVVFVELPNTKIELLHPLGEKSPIANFLARNADGGIHHVCYEVEDIYAARDKLKAAGRPRAGRRRAQDRRPRQAGAVPASQGFHRHADRARAGLRSGR